MKNERVTHLKVKIKNLADEARTIRLEEHKALERCSKKAGFSGYCPDYINLRDHRTGRVRHVARLNLLAYGYLRGMPYARIEQYTEELPDFNAVLGIIKRFGTEKDVETFDGWLLEALDHLKGKKAA